jgi:hypothetical protein
MLHKYIRWNTLRLLQPTRYIAHVAEWPHSTFKACARRGIYPASWLGLSAEALSADAVGE